jgi:succinate dehydrogenase / fumarate reductase cytochrome b subunit
MNLALVFSPDAYNAICGFLGARWYTLALTAVLAAGFIVHIVYAFWLTIQNRKARGNDRYAVNVRPEGVEWSSQNMLVLGIIVIVGLGLHFAQFWAKMQLPELMHKLGAEVDVTNAANGAFHIQATFSCWINVVLYLVWLAALWFHLTHGFWSALQSLGWNNQTWIKRWKCVSDIYATIIVLGFAAVVIAFFIKSLCCGAAC